MNDYINDFIVLQSLGHKLWEDKRIKEQPKHIDSEDDIEVVAKAPPKELKVKTEIL